MSSSKLAAHRRPRSRRTRLRILALPFVAAVLSAGNCPQDGMNGPSWQLVLSGLSGGLLSLSGTSATDVYAVGADPGDGKGPLIIHYDGQQWTRLDSGASGDLWWISDRMIGDSFFMGGEGGLLLRYTPSTGQFEQFAAPGTETVFGVWGEDENDVVACGGDLDQPDDSGVVWRFDGAQWSNEDLTSVDPAGIPVAFKVWGRSGNAVYVCGGRGLMLFYDGVSWSELDTGTTRTLFTVHGNDNLAVSCGGAQSGVLVEQNGNAFSDAAPQGLLQMNGVFVPPTGEAITVGFEGSVAFRRAGGWEIEDTGLGLDPTLDYHAAWIDPDGGVWAVGGNIRGEPRTNGMVSYFGEAMIGTTLVD